MDKDSNINVITTSYCSKTLLTIFSSFKTVYRALKSVNEPLNIEKYQILHICRTARFKIDSYIRKQETFWDCPGKGNFALLLLTSFEKLLGFLLYLSLQSLIMTNDFRIWTPRTRWISRTSWTPHCSVSRKVRLLKIIKTESVVNITRAYTEIFPKTDTKKTTLLTHQRQVYFGAMCNSQRQSTVFENSSENFIGICFPWICFLLFFKIPWI